MVEFLKQTPKPSVVTVTDEPTALPLVPLNDRKGLMIINTSDKTVYLTDADETALFPLPPDTPISFNASDVVIVYVKVLSGTAEVSILELK